TELTADAQLVADAQRRRAPPELLQRGHARGLEFPLLARAVRGACYEAVAHMRIVPPDLRDRAVQLGRLARIELGRERMVRTDEPRQRERHGSQEQFDRPTRHDSPLPYASPRHRIRLAARGL